jgi:hypothetical protein
MDPEMFQHKNGDADNHDAVTNDNNIAKNKQSDRRTGVVTNALYAYHDYDGLYKGEHVNYASVALASKMHFVRQIWLAGLGAYSNSMDELVIAGEKSSTFFEELLSRGKDVDNAFKLHTSEQYISLNSLEKLMNRAYSMITGIDGDKFTQLNEKVDDLLRQIEAIK